MSFILNNTKFTSITGVVLIFFSACKFYSFSGANIDYSQTKTISIANFENLAALAGPTYAQGLSETIREVFLTQTQLQIVNSAGDLELSGQIIDFSISPVAISSNDLASKNRVTMTVNVKFSNHKNPEDNFETTFSRFADFDATQSFSAVETDIMKDIYQQLAQDIFNRSLGNW